MNRVVFVFLTALSIAQGSSAFAQGPFTSKPESKVRWIDSIAAANKQRSETGRPMIVYFTADYCGYCRKMERETWADPNVARRIQNEFVALKLDAERNSELVARLGIKGLPATIIFDSEGQQVQTIFGYSRPAAVTEVLDSVSVGRTSLEPVSRDR